MAAACYLQPTAGSVCQKRGGEIYAFSLAYYNSLDCLPENVLGCKRNSTTSVRASLSARSLRQMPRCWQCLRLGIIGCEPHK